MEGYFTSELQTGGLIMKWELPGNNCPDAGQARQACGRKKGLGSRGLCILQYQTLQIVYNY
jgi:hypothetical protein